MPEPTRRRSQGHFQAVADRPFTVACTAHRRAATRLNVLGTRGDTKIRSTAHQMHSSQLVRCGSTRIMIDCGADWL